MQKRLAVTKDGQLTYCTATEENIGKGRCNHICHQKVGESEASFMARANQEIYRIKELSNSINFTTMEREALNDLKYIFDGYGTADETDIFVERQRSNGEMYVTIKEEYREYMPHAEEIIYIVNTRKKPKSGLRMKDNVDMVQAAKFCMDRGVDESGFYPNGSFCDCDTMDELRREWLYDKKYGLGLEEHERDQMSLSIFQRKYRKMCNYIPDYNERMYSSRERTQVEDFVRGHMTYVDGFNQDDLEIKMDEDFSTEMLDQKDGKVKMVKVYQAHAIYQGRDITPVVMEIASDHVERISLNNDEHMEHHSYRMETSESMNPLDDLEDRQIANSIAFALK